MISGGSRNLLRGKGNYCFNQENSKMGMVCIIYGEISEGSGPKLPPLDTPLVSLIKVANVDSTV